MTEPERTELSRHPGTAWVMLAVLVPVGGWLIYAIQTTIGLNDPHLWALLKTDRVFDFAMLDFFLTASWAFLVIAERSSWKDWRLWVTTPIFFVVPSLGIVVFLLLDRTRKRVKSAFVDNLLGDLALADLAPLPPGRPDGVV